MAKVVVFGNEKGGTGKSTLSMHTSIFFLRQNLRVGVIDVDARQGTISRYINNRQLKKKYNPQMNLPYPFCIPIFKSEKHNTQEAQRDEEERFQNAIDRLSDCDIIIVDTPGSDQYLSRVAHTYANVLVTPINDSFVDLDLLIHLDQDYKSLKPSIYAETVWEQRKERARKSRQSIEWIVLRNRIVATTSKNHQEMHAILKSLSKRIGFHYIEGFSERVIFKELFPAGITVLDLKENQMNFTNSHMYAKKELMNLVDLIIKLLYPDIYQSVS